MSRHGIKANFAINIAGTIVLLIVALVTTPIYVSHIGPARFGVLSIVWVLLGYFGFFDLGLSRASANALAKLDHSAHEERSKVLMTAFWLNVCLGIAGGMIFYFFGQLIMDHLIKVPSDLKPEIDAAFPWISSVLPLALVSGVGNGALESRERFLAANILGGTGGIIGQVFPVVCAVFISPSLAVVVPATVLARGLSVLMFLGFVMREEQPLKLWIFDRTRCRTLLGYGGWISASNIIGPLLDSLDRLVIGAALGVTAVTHYSVPMGIVMRSQILAAALSRTMFPRLSRSSKVAASGLAEKAIVTLGSAYGAISARAIVLSQPFLELWMGRDFALLSAPVAELLLIGSWVNGMAFIPYVRLQAQGRPDIVAKFHALELIPFVFILWILSQYFGLLGAATAWVLRVMADGGLLFIAARFSLSRLLQLAPPLGIVFAAYVLVCVSSLTILNAFLAAGLLTAAAGVCALIFDENARKLIVSLRLPRRSQKAN